MCEPTYTCPDRELYSHNHRVKKDIYYYASYFFKKKEKPRDDTAIKNQAMDQVIRAMEGGVNNIYEDIHIYYGGLENSETGKAVSSPSGIANYLGDVLSAGIELKNCPESPNPPASMVEKLDCYCLESLSKRLITCTKCIVEKLPHLKYNLNKILKRHTELLEKRNKLRNEYLNF